jgi:lactate permease
MNLSDSQRTLGAALASGGLLRVARAADRLIGVALTGSDTSSNSVFGQLQVAAATRRASRRYSMASITRRRRIGKCFQYRICRRRSRHRDGGCRKHPSGCSAGASLLASITILVVLQTGVLSWMVPSGS